MLIQYLKKRVADRRSRKIDALMSEFTSIVAELNEITPILLNEHKRNQLGAEINRGAPLEVIQATMENSFSLDKKYLALKIRAAQIQKEIEEI